MDYEKRKNQIKERLLEMPNILSQYATWLKNSERNTIYKGEDVYNMLVGVMHAIDGSTDFIPGVGWENFVDVITNIQKQTGLDLGVCKFLKYNREKISECSATAGLSIGSLKCCIPPNRCKCQYKKKKLEDELQKSLETRFKI